MKRVLITGGSGSIGTAILARAKDSGGEFVVFSRDEVKQAALASIHPDVTFYLGDVQDPDALARAMRGCGVVIHAAAYKRVPEAERETMACVGANVVGSMNVIRAAMRERSVEVVVGISTDKACHPINAYGQSKALMERLFQAAAREASDKRFTLTRYGNVLASRGSVIPAFREQARRGGITLTDPNMTRFWLTLDDAVDLIESALEAPSGTITIPRCKAASMAAIANAVAPGVPVTIIGARDGEKAHESLLNINEAPFADVSGPHFLLHPMVTPVATPATEPYTSADAPQMSPFQLRGVLEAMDAGTPVRTL